MLPAKTNPKEHKPNECHFWSDVPFLTLKLSKLVSDKIMSPSNDLPRGSVGFFLIDYKNVNSSLIVDLHKNSSKLEYYNHSEYYEEWEFNPS